MRVKDIVEENFQDYKKPSMFIATCFCTWKCCIENGNNICQNIDIVKQPTLNISDEVIVNKYIKNPITHAILFGGLEPFEQWEELIALIDKFRQFTDDDIVIYTGWNKTEIYEKIVYLFTHYKNVVIKFGRYIPNKKSRYDDILGVTLASDNQYAEKIS